MKIQTVKIDGYKNLSNVKIALSNITALVALNNFGKSNFLSGIDFAITFIKANIQKKIAMMSNSNCIPMHRNLQGRNYRYEMDASTEFNNHKYQLKYEFEFCWKNSVETDPFIVCESLKIKTADAQKFTQIIDRNCECATYRRTESGRCSTTINVCPAELVVNKLAAFDDLYYSEIIKQLNNVKVYIENNLDAKVFYQPDPIMRNGFESEMISVNNLPRIIFDIKEKYPDKFELLRDVYMQLFPNIDDLIVRKIQIDPQEPGQSGDTPYVFSKFIHFLYVCDQNFSNPINFETMSDGAKRVFMILTKIIVSTINDVSLIADTITHTNKFHDFLVTFTYAYNHIVDKRTVQTMIGLLLTVYNRSILIDGEMQCVVLFLNIDGRIDPLAQLALGTLNGNDVALLIEVNGNSGRNTNWQFSYS